MVKLARIICSQSLVMAGVASGATEGFVLTPFERVKVYMQAQRTQLSQVELNDISRMFTLCLL